MPIINGLDGFFNGRRPYNPRNAIVGPQQPSFGSGGESLPTIQPLSSFYEAETGTFATATGGATDAEKYAIDRFIKHCKQAGFWTRNAGASNTGIWLMCQDTESKCLVNLLHPGTKDLTKVGTPTFAALDGVSTGSVANYYESGIAINTLAQNSASIGGVCVSNNVGASNGYDMGALDASSTTRLLLMARTVTTNLMAGAAMGTTVAAIGTANDTSAPAFKAVSRTSSADFGVFNHGQRRVTQTNASVAPVGTTSVSFLFAKGASSYSRQKWGLFFVLDGLSDIEMAHFAGACQVLADGFRYGLPTVQPAGYGDAEVTYDFVVHGTSMSAICAAYAFKRDFPSLTVAIVCDYLTESVEQLGGMCANGLTWADVNSGVATPSSGLWYEMARRASLRQGGSPANTQAGVTLASQTWNIQCRRMLDATRSTGDLPGLDIPVYFSTGLRSVTKDGSNKITALTTSDGRVLHADIYAEEGYDGDLIYLAGVPYTSGREAGGSGKEGHNGWRITQRSKPGDNSTANRYNVDPYVAPATPASGLLPGVIVAPGYATGQAYAGLQAMAFRLQAVNGQTDKSRKAPFFGGPAYAQPSGYVALNYELLGRYLQACTDLGHTQSSNDLMTFNQDSVAGPYGDTLDLNNGSGVSVDLGNYADQYLAAGMNYAARKSAVQALMDFQRGFNYFVASSGDPRILAAVSNSFLNSWGLDASAFLDFHSMFPLYWPKLPYRREPNYMLNNGASGGAVLDGNDSIAADGGTPRISTDIVSMIQYQSFDHHGERWIAYDDGDGGGVVLQRQGTFSDTSAGNTNKRTPWPMEINMPVEADCPNLLTSTCPSMTKVAYAAGRMEPQMALAAQLNGLIAGQAITDAVSVQGVTYATVRALALASPDSVAPLLTQTT